MQVGIGAEVVAEVVGKSLHISKTRLAIEYALRHAVECSALLFVRADSPAVSAAVRACEEPQTVASWA
jgi:hypothetical protein